MGLNEVVDALERAEQLLEDGETGPAQDSLSWQRADDNADIQFGKACAMLGTCRQLRQGTDNYPELILFLRFGRSSQRPRGRATGAVPHATEAGRRRHYGEHLQNHVRQYKCWAAGGPDMFTIDMERFMLELNDGTYEHVGASNKTATAKLYDVTEAAVREFGDERVKLSCRDDSGNEIEIALDPPEAREIAREIERFEDESGVFE